MGEGTKTIFLRWLPRLLFMRRPANEGADALRQVDERRYGKGERIVLNYHEHRAARDTSHRRKGRLEATSSSDSRIQDLYNSPPVLKSFENLQFIAELLKKKDRDDKASFFDAVNCKTITFDLQIDADWVFVGMVLDRLFLVIFSVVCFVGTGVILMQAPTFWVSIFQQ